MTETGTTLTPPATGAEPDPEPEAEAEKQTTEYVILTSADGGSSWTVEGRQRGDGKRAALSHFYESNPLPDEVVDPLFQAIPSSSWKALKPAEPRPRIPFSEVE